MSQKAFSNIWALVIVIVIIIGGVLIWQYWSAPEEVSPPITGEQEEEEDETADWKIYTNSEFGYSIKYPKDWYVKEEYRTKYSLENLYIENMKEKVIVAGGGPFTENGSSFNIVILEAPNISSIEEWIQSGDLPDREKQRRLNSVTIMEIAGVRRNVWKGFGGLDMGIEFIQNYRCYRFHCVSGSQEQFNKDLDIFNQMLSTFRFLE